MILSDRTIREEIAAGRIVIDPFDDSCVQPSSVDLRIDRFFRVFRNHTMSYIDVKADQEELTELVEIAEEDVFILHPGEFVLGSTLERVALPRDLVARLEGKALGLDTPVPTTNGWLTMERVRVGDLVFDERGRPTPVVAVSEVMTHRPSREVVFSDGTVALADASHQWVTRTRNDRRHGRPPSIRTTDEIADSLMIGNNRNHEIALAEPVDGPVRELPIDPYVLGAWLGHGTSTAAHLTCAEPQIVDEIRKAGCDVHHYRGLLYRLGGTGHTRDVATGRYVRNDSMSSTLRNLGLWGDKHIPLMYLFASRDQRQALLEGLMDTDGYVDKYGRCELTTVKEDLALGYLELIASLGFRCYMRKDRARLYGVDCGPRYRIVFTPDRPVFRLERKLARQQEKQAGFHRRTRRVAAVREIGSVPVRCIQVGAPSGQFLITRSFIPTHNSSLGRLGLLIHSTAGFVDASFNGHLTLELSNVANLPITLYPGMKIGQISFLRMTTEADHPYGSKEAGSKYQGQRGPTPSRYFENFAPRDRKP